MNGSRNTTTNTTTRIENSGNKLSITARIKLLTRQYGVSALVVYTVISTLDLAGTFFVIQVGGGERVKKIEDWMKKIFDRWLTIPNMPKNPQNKKESEDGGQIAKTSKSQQEGNFGDSNESGKNMKQMSSWMSTFLIAYGIHKLLVPLRLGLTAAITPPLVKKLQKMGWNIGRQV
ncbi:hypothetical protein G9A89_020613 [Geosiphon pyriformis]|nr:hypothetical protein G9A89_020613 [Geosiphon pyriformis]